MIRQKNFDPKSLIGCIPFKILFDTVTATFRKGFFLGGCEKLQIVGWTWTTYAFTGTSPTLDVSLYSTTEGASPDSKDYDAAGSAGLTQRDTDDSDYQIDAAAENMTRLFDPPLECPGSTQTLNNTDRKGVGLKAVCTVGGTPTDISGELTIFVRPFMEGARDL